MSAVPYRLKPPASAGRRLIFLHVPKTAGTTLWLILRRQYSPQALLRLDDDSSVLTDQQWQNARVIAGHFAYGAHRRSQGPFDCVTVLREPLERTLSHYCHLLREAQVSPMLEECLSAGALWADNLQTRMLAGPAAEALPLGHCDRDVFEVAKRNLSDNIAVTGLTERFDETLMLLQRRFDWNMPCYVRENMGANRINREDVPRELLRQIWERTEWDRALYALAAARMDERIAQEGPSFAASLRRFRIANVQYRRMKALVAAGPLHVLKSRLALGGQMKLESAVRSLLGATPLISDWGSESRLLRKSR